MKAGGGGGGGDSKPCGVGIGEGVWVALVADAVHASGARGVDVAVGVAAVARAVTVALVHGVRGLLPLVRACACVHGSCIYCNVHRIDHREKCDHRGDDKDAHDELDDAGDQEQHTRLW